MWPGVILGCYGLSPCGTMRNMPLVSLISDRLACWVCGTDLDDGRTFKRVPNIMHGYPDARLCSQRCYETYRKRRYRVNLPGNDADHLVEPTYDGTTCVACGAHITSTRANRRFCTATCRVGWNRDQTGWRRELELERPDSTEGNPA